MKRLLLYSLVAVLSPLNYAFSFDFPYSEWNLANYNGAYATFNDGFISVVNGGSDYWHVQLTRKNIDLLADKTYEVKFYLQGVSARRNVEVRIGRDGFPYDAFAEFGEVVATVNGRTITKTFTMRSGNVSDARFEFNLGKNSGTVYLSNISLTCLDCGSSQSVGGNIAFAASASDWDYVVVADTVDFRDYSMSLGDVFGQNLELGADTKIYGNVDAMNNCFLRERANISGDLHYVSPCTEQNSVFAKTKGSAKLSKPTVDIPNVVSGISPVSVGLDESITLPPGNYGAFYANTRSKVHLLPGAYTFQNFYTEPDVYITFDLSTGPITIGVLGNVRFGDRNTLQIAGGNPSEISWNIAGENVNMGTDGRYFGRFVAPSAFVRIPSRSHLVGAVYARKFQIEPQSTISHEPQATEISHSEEHFGPFFKPGIFRYISQLPPSTSALEMFVYADNAQVKVNGGTSTKVELPSSNTNVNITLTRNLISGFPTEAFSSTYAFSFIKNANYRVYWNPQSQCKQGCDGSEPTTAIGDFATVLETAKATGREINMAGGVWNVSGNFSEGVVPWKVGFELVGNTNELWDLTSENALPLINLGNVAHIQIEGHSPRSLTGLRIANGFNVNNGGAINSSSQKIGLKNIIVSSSKSNNNGGALFTADTLNLENTRFSNNMANGKGGAVVINGKANVLNALFLNNTSTLNGGAIDLQNATTYIGNAIFYGNHASLSGGALYNEGATLNMWNTTFFANSAKTANGALGGIANGTIGNSIFWKNTVSGCNSEDCSSEVARGYTATNSSFANAYAGTNIHIGDPKFRDESNPAGNNIYMNYDAGINLSSTSPLLKFGTQNIDVPELDILGGERKGDEVQIGAYSYIMTIGEYYFGRLKSDESVEMVLPAIPIFNDIPDGWFRQCVAKSKLARVMKVLVEKHDVTKVNSATVAVTLMNKDGVKYENVRTVNIVFYRNGEENGKYVFQTMTSTKGKPIIFSYNDVNAQEYDDSIVLCIKDAADKFHLKIVDY